MDEADPLLSFFPEATSSTQGAILYTALSLTPSATPEEIRKSYRRLALQFHPDKHSSKPAAQRDELAMSFQRIGFAYAVLSEEGRKKRYDKTGRTDEKFAEVDEMGWDAYFESLYQRVDRKMLDDDKKKYQGSEDERDDIISAYGSTNGSLPDILSYIPHSSHTDEARFIELIIELIKSGDLEATPTWTKTSTDEKARAKRAKAGERAAKEAEKAAKELGVWEEFYGSGEKGKRVGDEKKGGKKDAGEGSLQALILKRQRERENGFDAMEEKYRKIEEEARAKKKAKKGKGKKKEEEEEAMPDISDADFEALQAKMLAKKSAEPSSTKATKTKTKKSKA